MLFKLKTGKNLKEDLMKKEKEKGEKKKKEKTDKTHVKIPLWSFNDRKKKSTKMGKNFRRREGGIFWLAEYIPLEFFQRKCYASFFRSYLCASVFRFVAVLSANIYSTYWSKQYIYNVWIPFCWIHYLGNVLEF